MDTEDAAQNKDVAMLQIPGLHDTPDGKAILAMLEENLMRVEVSLCVGPSQRVTLYTGVVDELATTYGTRPSTTRLLLTRSPGCDQSVDEFARRAAEAEEGAFDADSLRHARFQASALMTAYNTEGDTP
jgi:hypothetical protein